MHKFLNLFKSQNDDGSPKYPSSLLKRYRVNRKVLGVGSFAVVKLCHDKSTGEEFALKILAKAAYKGKEQMLNTELDVLKRVRHQYIVSLRDLFETKDGVFIVQDLASGGELFQRLMEKGSYTEKDASKLVKQVLEGIAYLHDMEIVHRDLKPENLLFRNQSEDSDLLITDFGLSKIINNNILFTACGTPQYVAPEVLLQTGHGKPVDMWSLGVIVYAMLCGYTPFWGEDQASLFDAIMEGSFEYEEDYWSEISNEAKDLINRLLTRDPRQRITAREALAHPWIVQETKSEVNLLANVRVNFNGRKTLRKAVQAVAAARRLKRDSLLPSPSDGPTEDVDTDTDITDSASPSEAAYDRALQ
ncbi:uncharacterized protein VTP21DRAFT_3069 [Calcarisporiella thermophila]|uniref:uncharacterized protein n=1 Tax=Calcarisporiella thermophila TaxID=911321 RepID=UPI003741F178